MKGCGYKSDGCGYKSDGRGYKADGCGYKAVIFDLDGTLIDSREDLGMAANRVLAAEGFPVWPLERYALFMGRGLRNLVVQALEPYTSDEAVIERVRGLLLEDYGRNCLVRTRFYPGIDKVLDFLSVNRIRTAVLSNKPHEITCRIMDGLFANRPFNVVRGAVAGMPLKPEPEALWRICEELSVGVGEVLYAGDSEVDVETAAKAGTSCAVCSWGYRTRRVLEEALLLRRSSLPQARLIDKPEDIIALCEKIY